MVRGGASVIADAVFDRPGERASIETVARKAGCLFHGFWLEAPKDMLLDRIGARTNDPSDATAAVLESQLGRGVGDMRWTRVDARCKPSVAAAQLLSAIGTTGLPRPQSPGA
jgi:predicted kinase